MIDGEPQAENGSTVRSGALALRARGRLAAFAFATTTADIDPTVLLAAGDDFVPASADALGGGGHHKFRFKVVGTGSGKVRLIKRRAWEPESAAVDRLEATIPVAKKGAP